MEEEERAPEAPARLEAMWPLGPGPEQADQQSWGRRDRHRASGFANNSFQGNGFTWSHTVEPMRRMEECSLLSPHQSAHHATHSKVFEGKAGNPETIITICKTLTT